MKSLFEPAVRDETIRRLRQVRADACPAWGTLTAPRMMCHLLDSLKISFGDVPVTFKPNPLANALGRWFVISCPLPWPRGRLKAPPIFFATAPAPEFEQDRAAVIAGLERFARGPAQAWGISPFLGPLTPEQWAKLNYRHCDHHLRQFGQ